MRTPRDVMAKPGPKLKINDEAQAAVVATIASGGSLNDAADLIGVDRKTLYNRMKADAGFSNRLMEAEARGKLRLIKRIKTSKDWKAAAWMLERKWGAEFGRKLDLTHAGKIDHTVRPLMEKILSTPAGLQAARTLIAQRERMCANGNGHNGNGSN